MTSDCTNYQLVQEGLTDDGFCDVVEAKTFLGLGRTKVYQMMDAGELAYAHFGRARRIPRRALREMSAARIVGLVDGGNRVTREIPPSASQRPSSSCSVCFPAGVFRSQPDSQRCSIMP